ncbi:VP3 [Chicken proventriculitis-associated circular virus 19]|nr:VP3 [Chicken proventriculitis-associated circular virus 19]
MENTKDEKAMVAEDVPVLVSNSRDALKRAMDDEGSTETGSDGTDVWAELTPEEHVEEAIQLLKEVRDAMEVHVLPHISNSTMLRSISDKLSPITGLISTLSNCKTFLASTPSSPHSLQPTNTLKSNGVSLNSKVNTQERYADLTELGRKLFPSKTLQHK